ncbi:hypothetical protein QVD17_33014 [Tagetes erecta]|uniref:Uncharacterized protein n=1 Tax=Tagetes erecta TaxID=13708 RepID=A0AAD8JYB4_TARER|nr:hypothetical protein QVD17_33014 [Tagetes erecta]
MDKSKQVHSFNLPPQLTWGTQKLLRCMNFNPNSKDVSREEDEEDQISETREKLTKEYQADVEKLRKTTPEINMLNARILEKTSTRPRRNIEKKKKERPKFSIALSWKEIEDDFIAMTGKKPPRRPNKRPKSVRMMLDDVFPGSQLCEVSRDRYKVNENGKM